MFLDSLISLITGLLNGPDGDGMPDWSDGTGPSGPSTTRWGNSVTKTQGTGYFNKPSRGYFGTNTGTPRTTHESLEDVARAAGVPPLDPPEA